jgi:hypothetical protein
VALELIGIILIVLLLLNAWATRTVVRDHLASSGQRTAQIVFVWFVPFFGALLTLHLKRMQPELSTGSYPTERDPGDDFGYSRPRHHRNENSPDAEGSSSAEGASDD